MMKKIKAFTLAETLVTLGIVGVIAAMTIPTLKKGADETKYVSLLRKAYAEASTATQMVEAKYGESTFWDWNSSSTVSRYKEFMKAVPPSSKAQWCSRQLDGRGQECFSMDGDRVFMTMDGMAWYFHDVKHGKVILVDTNGEAEPNIVGVDVHGFKVDDKRGLAALGNGFNEGNATWACTAYAIKHNKMPWITDTSITNCEGLVGK